VRLARRDRRGRSLRGGRKRGDAVGGRAGGGDGAVGGGRRGEGEAGQRGANSVEGGNKGEVGPGAPRAMQGQRECGRVGCGGWGEGGR